MTAVDLHLIANVAYHGQLGSFHTPVITHVAACVAPQPYGPPAMTMTGVVCAACTTGCHLGDKRIQVRHVDVTAVRECADRRAAEQAEAEAEMTLYRREEAYWNNGGPHAEAIWNDLELDRRHGM